MQIKKVLQQDAVHLVLVYALLRVMADVNLAAAQFARPLAQIAVKMDVKMKHKAVIILLIVL